jgi:hypothetical protein
MKVPGDECGWHDQTKKTYPRAKRGGSLGYWPQTVARPKWVLLTDRCRLPSSRSLDSWGMRSNLLGTHASSVGLEPRTVVLCCQSAKNIVFYSTTLDVRYDWRYDFESSWRCSLCMLWNAAGVLVMARNTNSTKNVVFSCCTFRAAELNNWFYLWLE